MFFDTKRLLVRELTLDDIMPLDEMQSNEKVMKYIIGRPKTKEESIVDLEKILSIYGKGNNYFLVMAVVKKEDDQFVGTCAIIKNEDGEHELGYRLMEKHWGNGYGQEILNSLITFALKLPDLNEVVAYVNKDNYLSVKILDSSEFNSIKEYKENETGDVIRYYKILKLKVD